MEKIWIVDAQQLERIKETAITVYKRDFDNRGISADRIADTDSAREEFVAKCYTELNIGTLGDRLVTALINARKSKEL
jgi:hypothetical protein